MGVENLSRKAPAQIKISVTISTWMRRDLLKKLILSLEDQTIPRNEYEILICDSSSPDGTAEEIQKLCSIYNNIKYINIQKNTPSAKRNAGIRQAKGQLIILLDDDVLVGKSFIEAYVEAHQGKNKIVFCGHVRFPKEWITKSNYFRFRDSRHLGSTRPEIDNQDIPFHLIVTMNMSFKRNEIIESVGLISEEFDHYGCEDYEFGYRISKAGFRIEFVENALVYHYEPPGKIEQYIRKIYITARYSVPILHRLVPDSINQVPFCYLEPMNKLDNIGTKTKKIALSICASRAIMSVIKFYLERTDHIRWLYWSLLFRYLICAAYIEGVRDRSISDEDKEKGPWIS